MADTIEKVYCTGDGGNDNLAAALLARGRDNDPATMLAAGFAAAVQRCTPGVEPAETER